MGQAGLVLLAAGVPGDGSIFSVCISWLGCIPHLAGSLRSGFLGPSPGVQTGNTNRPHLPLMATQRLGAGSLISLHSLHIFCKATTLTIWNTRFRIMGKSAVLALEATSYTFGES